MITEVTGRIEYEAYGWGYFDCKEGKPYDKHYSLSEKLMDKYKQGWEFCETELKNSGLCKAVSDWNWLFAS